MATYTDFTTNLPEGMYTAFTGGQFAIGNNCLSFLSRGEIMRATFQSWNAPHATFAGNGYNVIVTVGHVGAPYRGTVKIEHVNEGDSNVMVFQALYW